MSGTRYEELIEAAVEGPHVDFKRAMSWSRDNECERFEVLTDIAAMCTYGGGVLIIGRDDSDKRSGTMTSEQISTFDPTKVNEYLRGYLRPMPSVRVVPLEHRGDHLVVLDVPGFSETPPCFQEPSQCANAGHRGDRRHFSRGDVYVRTAAAQTTKICDPEDWRTLWRQIERNVRGSVTFGVATDSADEADPYAEERQEDERSYRLPWDVPSTTGTIEVAVRPCSYVVDRVPRLKLKPMLDALRASILVPGNDVPQEMPYREGAEVRNFGRGVVLFNNHPEWKRCENAVLRCSGSFEFRRILPEDYNAQNTIDANDTKLMLVGAALDLTLALTMAARLATEISDPDELVDMTVAMRGLMNRRIEDDSISYGARIPLLLTVGLGHSSLEAEVCVARRLSVKQLETTCRELAVEAFQEILWTFGVEPSTATVEGWQNAFKNASGPPRLNRGPS